MAKQIVITPRGFANCGLYNAKLIKDSGFDLIYNDTGLAYTKEEFYEITKDADGIIVGVESVDRAYIDCHPKLKAVVKFGVGTDNIDVEYCKEKGIFVGRTVGSNSRSVAETALAFIIADSKNLYESFTSAKSSGWAKKTGYEIYGKTVGIIGFGAIGKLVAEMAHALGMRVLAYDAFGIEKSVADSLHTEIAGIDEIIENSDFVSLHVPLTEETKNMISANELQRMKKNAVLINTARGGVVNEADLYEALKCGVIKAAYFDVFSSEPPKSDEPLLSLPNFYLTPHVASRSREAEKNAADMSTKIIIKALSDT